MRVIQFVLVIAMLATTALPASASASPAVTSDSPAVTSDSPAETSADLGAAESVCVQLLMEHCVDVPTRACVNSPVATPFQPCVEADEPVPLIGVEPETRQLSDSSDLPFAGDTNPTDAVWWNYEHTAADAAPSGVAASRTICGGDEDTKWHITGNKDGYYTDYKSGWYNWYTNSYGDGYYYYMQSRSWFYYLQKKCVRLTNKYVYRKLFRIDRRYRTCVAPSTGCWTGSWEYTRYRAPKCFEYAPNGVAVYCKNRYGSVK